MRANSSCSSLSSNGEKLYSRLIREERKNSHQESTSFMPTAIKVRERKKWWDISPRGIKDMSGVREGWVRGNHPRQPCKCYEWKWVVLGGADAIDSASAAHARADTTRLQTDRRTDLLATYENRKWTSSQPWNYMFSLVINKRNIVSN